MSTADAPRESIPIALIREAIENTLAIPSPDNISALSITFNGGSGGQVNVIRAGKHGPYGETYAIDRSTITCPQCHQELGRPHTEYCPLRIREEIFAGIENAEYPGQPGTRIFTSLEHTLIVDGRSTTHLRTLCKPEYCGSQPTTEETAEALNAQLAAATSFVDDGCRCPDRDNHAPGCPALPHEYIEAVDSGVVDPDSEPYCWTCGAGRDDPRHATC